MPSAATSPSAALRVLRALRQGAQDGRTGFPDEVQLACRTRAGLGEIGSAQCEACGKWLGRYFGEVRYRAPRGIAGRQAPGDENISNAVLLCGSAFDSFGCSGLAEDRDPGMEARGFWIRPGDGPEHDPRYLPVRLPGARGPLITVWLSGTGGYSTDEPPGATA
jgi:hypothetical protein